MRARRRLGFLTLSLVVALAGCGGRSRVHLPLTIVVSTGPFATPEEAASAEAKVNWWDADPRDDDACTESFAAAELKRYLPRCLGIPPSSVRVSSTLPADGEVIFLGSRSSSTLVAKLAEGEVPPPQGYHIQSRSRENVRTIVIEGGDRTGSLYGAYALLEVLGVRFDGLGDSSTVLPASPFRWTRELSLPGSPAFTTRGFWAWEPRGDRPFFEWMARNRMNLWTSADTVFVPLMKKLGIRLEGGGHRIQADYLDPKTYFAAHPEWYGLHGGRRSPHITGESGDNFCTGNPAARRQLTRNVVAALASGSLRHADVLELWMLDAGRWCECDLCRAQGSPSDRLLAVANEVAAAVDSARRSGALARPVEVRTLAYLETRTPPERARPARNLSIVFYPYFRCYAHALDDSACTELNARIAADLQKWRAVAPSLPGVCEYYNVGAFRSLPLVFPHVMARDLLAYRQGGVTEISYMHVPTRSWGTWALHQALFACLAWNPGANVDSLVSRFCHEFYPGAGDETVLFYRELETASANVLVLQASAGVYGSAGAGGRLAQPATPVFPLEHLRDAAFHPAKNDAPDLAEIEAAMHRARDHLERALRAARGPLARARLQEVERRFSYGEAMFTLYIALIRTALADRARDGDRARREFARARAAAERLRGVRDLVQVAASHANAADGFEASGVRATYEYFERLYGR